MTGRMRRQDTVAWTGRSASDANAHSVGRSVETLPMQALPPTREHIPHRDALTNLPNRFLLADRLRQALLQGQRRGQALAVAYLDLDGVKAIQEIHGRAVRDELLLSVSQRMKQAMREGDTLARLEGDEFVAVLVDLNSHRDSESVFDRLTLVASDPVTVDDVVLHVKASVGITLYPKGGVDVDLLLRHADQAFCQDDPQGGSRYQMFDLDLSDMETDMKNRQDAA